MFKYFRTFVAICNYTCTGESFLGLGLGLGLELGLLGLEFGLVFRLIP